MTARRTNWAPILLVGAVALGPQACSEESSPAGASAGPGPTGPGPGSGGDTTMGGSPGTGGAPAGGTGGTSQGGAGQGGNPDGGNMISVGGGQGECNNCNEYITACLSSGCPLKNTLCLDSVKLYSDLFVCLCPACFSDCEHTCSGVNSDQSGCATCLQAELAGTCATAYSDCLADTI